MNSELRSSTNNDITKVDVEGSLNGLHARQDEVKMYNSGNLSSETENEDQRSLNIGGENDGVKIESEPETGIERADVIRSRPSLLKTDQQDPILSKERVLHVPKRSDSSDSFDADQLPDVPDSSSISSCSSDEENNVDLSRMAIGSSTSYQDEDGNKKAFGKPNNYCNIAVVLKIFLLYLANPASFFNQLIEQLDLKELKTLKTKLEEQTIESAIKFFSCRGPCKNENFYGNPFERLCEFAKRDGLLQHQQSYPGYDERPTQYDVLAVMIREELKKGILGFQDAVSLVLKGNGLPYMPTKTSPFLTFYLHDVIEKTSQLPDKLNYKEYCYQLAGVIFHRSDRSDSKNDHYVVRGYDPEYQKWLYNTDSDGDWEEDRGDPKSDAEHEYTLSTVVYIIVDPPLSIVSQPSMGAQLPEHGNQIILGNNVKCDKPPQET